MKLANVTAQPTRNLNPESLRGRTFFFRQTSLQLMSPHALQGRGGICMSGFWRDASLWASSLSGQDSEEETDRELIWGFIRRHPQLDVRTVIAAAGPNDSHRGKKKKKTSSKNLPLDCRQLLSVFFCRGSLCVSSLWVRVCVDCSLFLTQWGRLAEWLLTHTPALPVRPPAKLRSVRSHRHSSRYVGGVWFVCAGRRENRPEPHRCCRRRQQSRPSESTQHKSAPNVRPKHLNRSAKKPWKLAHACGCQIFSSYFYSSTQKENVTKQTKRQRRSKKEGQVTGN